MVFGGAADSPYGDDAPSGVSGTGTVSTIPSGSFDPAKTPALFRLVFPSVMLPMFLAVSDQTIVASALPAMAASLGDVERVSWVVVATMITSAQSH
jgi:hypothetical protein